MRERLRVGLLAQKGETMETPKPMAGTWTLTAPDGRTWQADSPLRACGLEQRERVPAQVAMARILEAASPTPDERDAERYRWLCANNFDREGAAQVHTWLHTWEPHSQTGEPTEWMQRIRGGALDAAIAAAMTIEAAVGAA